MILHYFFNVFMGNGHKGLSQLAEDAGIDVTGIKPGQYVYFLNQKGNAYKLFAANNTVVYRKLEEGDVTEAEYLKIPKFSAAKEIVLPKAMRDAILKTVEQEKEKVRKDKAAKIAAKAKKSKK